MATITFEIVRQAYQTKVYVSGEVFNYYSATDTLHKIKRDCANHAEANNLHLVGFNVFDEIDGKRTTVELADTQEEDVSDLYA